jgi:uncharacterized SAM-dependent methyltransferase
MNFYNETKRFLKKTKADVWELTSPHVLYLSEEQGRSYASHKDDAEYRKFHDETVEIVQTNAGQILGAPHSGIALIDLGPEYPDKTLPLMIEAWKRGIDLDYIPVDVNEGYVQTAIRAARPYATRIFGVNALFDSCAAHIPVEVTGPRMVFIGLTFMNFNPQDILGVMKAIAKPGGIVAVASELLTPHNTPQDVLKHYQNQQAYEFALGPMRNLQLDPQKLDFDVRFENRRVEAGFIFRKAATDLGISAGQRIIAAVSYRYSRQEFEHILTTTIGPTRLWQSESRKNALALSEVKIG